MKTLLIATVVAVGSVFAPIKGMLITVLLLIVADLITGILAARKRSESIDSSAIRRTVSKLLGYEGLLALTYLAQKYLMADAIPAVNMVASIIGMVELKSVLENSNCLAGKDLFKSLIDLLGSQNKPPQG